MLDSQTKQRNPENFKQEIEALIAERKAKYRKQDGGIDVAEIEATFNREKATTDGYNGRQLLELIQNADDAKSDEILVKLNTKEQTLIIANKGKSCDSFSIDGIKSLLLANLSPKDSSNNYIGNKGLGFRSIINWSDKIIINSNNLDIVFSQDIANEAFKDSDFKKTELPILAIPKLEDNIQNEWKTRISIVYKNDFLDDIKKQIEQLKPEILLFLNHLKTIKIDIDGKERDINKSDIWTIKSKNGYFPKELLTENDENTKYELKIAYNPTLTNLNNPYLFSYFPTKININLPFIVHGTFELDSSRNQLTNNRKNKFVIEKLVNFIIETALSLKDEDEVDYKALSFLKYTDKNPILDDLGFYEKIEDAIENKDIYPCIDNIYRKKSNIVYSNDFAYFINNNNFSNDIPYLLKPASNEEINFLDLLDLYDFRRIDKKSLESINDKIENIDIRVNFIDLLIENEFEKKLPLLIDENENLITEDEAYTPANTEFPLPDYVHIKFVNQDLYEKLQEKLGADEVIKKLAGISSIKPYNATEILRKIITSTNKKLEKEGVNQSDLIKKMVRHLYKNYQQHQPEISNQNIQLLDAKKQLQEAGNLYLSKTYPSGELTFELFGDIFGDDEFLADIDTFNLGDDKQKIEDFFLWLGVDKHTKFLEKTLGKHSNYGEYIKSKYLKNNEYMSSLEQNVLDNFDRIKDNISKERFIVWCLKSDIKDKISNDVLVGCEGEKGGWRGRIPVENYTLFQLKKADFFTDYLITDKKMMALVNDEIVNYNDKLFKKYDIRKADIDSLLLKIGAVETFSELSFEKVQSVLNASPKKDPNGKLAQKIYLESFKFKNNTLDDNIPLFAQKGDEKGYFNQNEVYYSGVKKLPKEYTKTKAIFDYPKKIEITDIVQFFSIQDLAGVDITIKNKEKSNINNSFLQYFKNIKPYILAYRLENIENDEIKNSEVKKIQDINIELCSSLTCEIDEEKYELSNYDYLIDNETYLIKVLNEKLDKIRQEYGFYTIFGDIIGLLFGLKETDKFQNCIKDSRQNTKRYINENISNSAIDEARELLRISSDFYNFWHTIYAMLEREYTDNYNDNLPLIQQELKIEIEDIDYENLSNKANGKALIKLFNELNIIVDTFNQQANQPIDLSAYHQQKLNDCFNDNEHQFKQCLHQSLQNGDQDLYLEKINEYKAPEKNYQTELEVDYQQVCISFVKETFGFELLEIKNNIDKIYKNNKNILSTDEHLPNEIESLLYFKNGVSKIQQWIDDNKQIDEENLQVTTEIQPIKVIGEERELKTISIKTPISNNHKRYNSNQDKRNKKAGDKAEQEVFDALTKKFDKENVTWTSKEDDSAGYDIKYKDKNGKWWYVEVKTKSNNQFYITENEKNFAQAHKESYKIFLVGKTIKKILVDFENDNPKLNPCKYIVRYNLKK